MNDQKNKNIPLHMRSKVNANANEVCRSQMLSLEWIVCGISDGVGKLRGEGGRRREGPSLRV